MKGETISITEKADVQLNEKEKFYEELGRINSSEQHDVQTQNENEETKTELSNEKDHDSDTTDNHDSDSVDDTDQDNDEANKHLIPRKRLNKELEKRKALEAEIAKEREERIKAQTELELYTKALEKSFAPQRQDLEEEMKQFSPLDEEAHKMYMNTFQKMEQQQKQFLMQKTLETQEAQFKNQHNDFDNAYAYLIDLQTKVNENLGFDKNTAKAMTMQNLSSMAQGLLSQGKNVAEVFYNISKEYGYQNRNEVTTKGPNLDAINENMKKSKIAEVNSVPVNIRDGGAQYTKISEFEKHYKGENKNDVFYKMLNQIRNNS